MNEQKKPRARRISSAEALAWVLNLRLRNTAAKFILCALSQYVDGDGICFVSISSLAEDTELSDQTIRSRLAWLEEVGVIARSPQWIDEFGNRNSTGKGRRTSDNIRLMVALNQEQIEERAQNRSRKNTSESDPQNQHDDEVDPQNVTLSAEDAPSCLPPHLPPHLPSSCAEGLISEPEQEQESPSKSPQRGDEREDASQEESGTVSEPDQFASFWASYPGHEVMSRFRALEIFATMTVDEQRHARAAAPLLRETLANMKRRPRDAHKWLAEKGWKEFPQAAGAPNVVSISLTYPTDTAEAKALLVIHDICGLGTGFRKIFVGKDKLIRYKKPMTKRILAFASIPPRDAWLKPTVQQAQAWTEFFREVAALNLMKRIDSHDYVPWPWPPKADGKIYTATGPPPAITAAHETEDDLANFS